MINTDYKDHWDAKFRERSWGRYPPEDLVRFVGRNYFGLPATERAHTHMLEVGCGPGANLWFLHREGFAVAGIDGSSHAIALAGERLIGENGRTPAPEPDLRVGDFQTLPWPDGAFDVVVDVFALYANREAVIRRSVLEIVRVLRPGGRLYTKLWGTACEGYGLGQPVEPDTFDAIPIGPCANMGVTHFVTREAIPSLFAPLRVDAIDRTTREDNCHGFAEEFHCQFTKISG